MKILLINKYFFLRGGSETSYFNTAKILRRNGHQLSFFSMSHPLNFQTDDSKYFIPEVDFDKPSTLAEKLKFTAGILYSSEAKKKLSTLIDRASPDIVHLHNIHHQISPSILHTLKKRGLPVVMTLHDYKMVCPVYTLLNRGQVCERCAGKKFFNCAVYRCCKGSFAKSILNTLEMYLHHTILHIYEQIDVFISPSRFLKNKLEEMGFKGDMHHLTNFVDPEDFVPSYSWEGNTILYFGRLSREKGISTLLQAVHGLPVVCKIFGEGPEKGGIKKEIEELGAANVVMCGFVSQDRLRKEIQKSMFVVLPSQWYENNPFSILESFALGKPVIGSKIGGIQELIEDYKTGLTFEPGNAEELKKNILYLINNSEKISHLGRNARNFVEQTCNPNRHYKELMNIYRLAIGKSK